MSEWNWYDTSSTHDYVVPTANDDLFFVGYQSPGDHTYLPVPMTAPEGSQQHMYMVMMGMPVNEAFQPNRDFTIPILDLPTLRGVHLVSNYTEHVSVYDGQELGRLELRTGQFDQIGDYADLYIGFNLDFTGGTLNSTSNLGSVVHLTGNISSPGEVATANLQPLLSPLTIGSTISLEGLGYEGGGGAMHVWNGDYNFLNDADVIVLTYCNMQVGETDESPTFTGSVKATTTGGTKGYSDWKVYGVGTISALSGTAVVTVQSLTNNQTQGNLLIPSGAKIDLHATSRTLSIWVQSGATRDGVLRIEGGTHVILANPLYVDGMLSIIPIEATETVAAKKTVQITGDLVIETEGTLTMKSKGSAFPALGVSGTVDFYGLGIFDVDGGIVGNQSYLAAGGIITFSEFTKIRVKSVPNAPANGTAWELMRSTVSINNVVPTIDETANTEYTPGFTPELHNPNDAVKTHLKVSYAG